MAADFAASESVSHAVLAVADVLVFGTRLVAGSVAAAAVVAAPIAGSILAAAPGPIAAALVPVFADAPITITITAPDGAVQEYEIVVTLGSGATLSFPNQGYGLFTVEASL